MNLLNTKELSKRSGVSATAIHRYIREGSIVPRAQNGKVSFFAVADIEVVKNIKRQNSAEASRRAWDTRRAKAESQEQPLVADQSDRIEVKIDNLIDRLNRIEADLKNLLSQLG